MLHTSTLGQHYATFTLRKFVVCSTRYKNSFITYEQFDTLYINNDLFFKTQLHLQKKRAHSNPKLFASNYLTLADIKESWDKGVVFPESDNKINGESLISKITALKANDTWTLLNPYGLFRTTLRKIIHDYRLNLKRFLNEKENESLDPSELFDHIASDVEIHKLPASLQEAYNNLQDDQHSEKNKQRIINIFKALLNNDSFFQEIALAKMSAVQDAWAYTTKTSGGKNRINKLSLIQFGFVGVANHHDIKIKVDLYDEFKDLLQVNTDDIIERKIIQCNLVNIYTIDDIDVSLIINAGEIKSLLFGKALKKIQGILSGQK